MASPSKLLTIGASNYQPTVTKYKPKPTTIDIVGGIFCHICHLTFSNKKQFDSHYVEHNTGATRADFVYTCVVCQKEIVGYPSFRGHCYSAHVVKDKFKCEYCQKVLSKQSSLQSHIKSVHKDIYQCSICQKEFKSQNEFYIHKFIHKTGKEGPPFDCHICNEVVENTTDCEIHIEDHCSMLYSCPICNEDIDNLQNANGHLSKHFGNVLKKINNETDPSETVEVSNEIAIDIIGGIFCYFCNDTYKTRNDFDNHFSMEHPESDILYACNICQKDFKTYLMLANHCYGHTSKDKFECEECFKTFPRLSLLVIHMETYHSNIVPANDSPFKCLQCNQSYKSDRRLKDHYDYAHKIKYRQCPINGCDKTFDAPKDLVLHLKEHNSEDNWCKQCGLRFYSLDACEKHLHVHKKKVYFCPICHRSYQEKHFVMKHVHQHFSAVYHVCKVCGKVYNIRNRLVEHMKVHSQIKPHVCSHCGKGFTNIVLLKQHLNMHTGLKPYKCKACPRSFGTYPNFKKHLKNIHNILSIDSKWLNENNNQSPADNIVTGGNFTDDLMDSEMSESVSPDSNTQATGEIVESTADMSVDVSTTNSLVESEESYQLSDIDPVILELLEENMVGLDTELCNFDEIAKDLWVNPSAAQPEVAAEGAALVEYGPEFVGEGESARAGDIRLDDGPLPHIDPRLTLLQAHPPTPLQAHPPTPLQTHPPNLQAYTFAPPEPHWEPPVFTKFDFPCELDATKIAVMNTNVY